MADRRAAILAFGTFPASTDAFVVAGITRAIRLPQETWNRID